VALRPLISQSLPLSAIIKYTTKLTFFQGNGYLFCSLAKGTGLRYLLNAAQVLGPTLPST
jgi:hypothetical protein